MIFCQFFYMFYNFKTPKENRELDLFAIFPQGKIWLLMFNTILMFFSETPPYFVLIGLTHYVTYDFSTGISYMYTIYF